MKPKIKKTNYSSATTSDAAQHSLAHAKRISNLTHSANQACVGKTKPAPKK